MLLPGPEAQQLATYIGWLLHGVRGGIAAGVLFILPGFVLMTLIATAYVLFGELPWLQGMLFGLQTATLAVVVEALLRMGRKTLGRPSHYALAGAAFVGIFAFGLPFPLIIAAAALIGLGSRWLAPGAFSSPSAAEESPAPVMPKAWTLHVLFSGAALWGLPVTLLVVCLGAQHVFAAEALFFSKMAVVTFGGAYAVLAYMAQQAVERYGWLYPGEMVQGLALAETTPGPLILVLTYVGFLGAYRDPGSLPPLLAGVTGATISTWVTFVPCFLWIFLGAPYIERLRGNRWLASTLDAIKAAVVGVILNLSLWFSLHVLFAQVNEWRRFGLKLPVPELTSVNAAAVLLGAAALLALLRFKINLMVVLALSAAAGLVLKLV
jgi:chromate transporter